MEEAVRVNNSFLYQQYVKNESHKVEFPEKDPFIEVEDQVAVR